MQTVRMLLLVIFLVGVGLALIGLVSWLIALLRHRETKPMRRLTWLSGGVALAALIVNAFT
ncbi:hypothetical protein [Lacticaseibacillus paracasei]|uniref:Uncharacterized protein n=1 Tax=Lacticaseibacillus paracasei TaxID=1597 RepID=A0ABD7BSR5_LACPA|nr:hypothetical protein [Lacticaseibacillus paracasei]QOP55673.1 hypothetical protein HCJ88_07670 [Lacticaseibacillus paracasei]